MQVSNGDQEFLDINLKTIDRIDVVLVLCVGGKRRLSPDFTKTIKCVV